MNVFTILHFFCFYGSKVFMSKHNKSKISVTTMDINVDSHNNNMSTYRTRTNTDTINSPSDFAIFINKNRKKTLFNGYDGRFPFLEDVSKSRNYEWNVKLALLQTLENPSVSELTKIQLIEKHGEIFSNDESKKALYRGFEDFLQ